MWAWRSMLKRRSFIALALALAGCATPPVSTVPLASWEALQVQAGEQPLGIDKQASKLRAYIFRAGAAARLGHNHVLSATDFDARAFLGETGLSSARLQMDLQLDKLLVDDPTLRAELGGAFAKPLDADAIQGTRANMLGERGLHATVYPLLRLRSVKLVGEAPRLAALVEIELHGQRRQQWLVLRVNEQERRLTVSGSLVLRQTDFGLQPFSLLGGLLAVSDEIVVEFEIALVKPNGAAAAKG